MRKNSQVHFFVETEILEKLKDQASKEKVSLSKFCRDKVKEHCLLAKIHESLEEIKKKVS